MDTQQSAWEQKVLQLLCSLELNAGERAVLCEALRGKTFLDATHRVVFEEICALGALEALRLRELLPARMTNRGFPDMDVDEYFSG